MADWGYNAISNGGNEENLWRTLKAGEWSYVLNSRSGSRYAKAKVNEVCGIIIFPDGWNMFNYLLNDINESGAPFITNTITTEDWMNLLEANGAVFLPITGSREGTEGTNVVNIDSYGFYWSASYSDSDEARTMYFSNSSLGVSYGGYRSKGRSVRLVCDAE